ncbi:LysR family transcriptional regulator [Caproiciproducens faecalis]|uniref:LysR family transcriptional regulator n=1 Tax=Caproiciproducens faecalis TaxID=2820301 RepID=A0ABS7DPK6_9FIRM|nr:LysR family transcriptional regulator [Caproiciproducens faecalis]MBW7573207.1 LysR family transcriptional regulator [Caproiciproducens faecalis]
MIPGVVLLYSDNRNISNTIGIILNIVSQLYWGIAKKMNFNPRSIPYVQAIAEERSISKAAERLYISQPSLSQYILRLEREIGVPLFDRSNVPITLTYAGERYLEAANEFLKIEENISREMDDISQSRRGRICVGVSAFRGGVIVPPIFSRFKKAYPDVELKLVESSNNNNLLDLVQEGKADFAFVSSINEDVQSIKLLDEKVLLAAHANVFSETQRDKMLSVNLLDLKEEPFILLTPGKGIRMIADRIFADYGFHPKIAYETRSIEIAFRLAEADQGCTFIVESYYMNQKTTAINCFHLDRGNYSYPLYLCYKKDAYLSKSMIYFVELSKMLIDNASRSHMRIR